MEWISVEDRLPELPERSTYERVECIVAVKGVEKSMAMHFCKTKVRDKTVYRWEWRGKSQLAWEVTHWQPLPQPPKEN